jgi:antirestriction protein ArdC
VGQRDGAELRGSYLDDLQKATELDAHIRTGEKGSLVVYADSITRKETDEKTGDEIDREVPFLKGYTVFNVEQIDGPRKLITRKPHLTWTQLPASNTWKSSSQPWEQLSDTAEIARFTASPPMRSRCRHSRVSRRRTVITQSLPTNAPIGGNKTRLDRDFGGHRFGSEGYAVEELVAELGAAFLCSDLELALEPREHHASYIATWLKVLAADRRAVFTAAAHAQRAAEFINRRSTESDAAQDATTCAA